MNIRCLISLAMLGAILTGRSEEVSLAPAGLVDLTRPSGTVTYSPSSNWSKPAKNAFDNGTTFGDSDRASVKAKAGEIVYSFPEPTVVDAYRIWTARNSYKPDQRIPWTWTYEGSDDGETWQTLDTVTSAGWSANETSKYYEFENAHAYSKYRFAWTATGASGDEYTQIGELEYFRLVFPILDECLAQQVEQGKLKATVSLRKNAGTAFVVLCAEDGTEVTNSVGAVTTAAPLTATVDPRSTVGFDSTKTYSVRIVVTNESGSDWRDLPGLFYFGALSERKTGDYAKHFTVTMPSADIGAASLVDVAVPVRLSISISGFSYDDFETAGGGDLMFTDDYGNVLPHEIAVWNAAGESLVWVRVPVLAANTVFHAYYGGPASGVAASRVWQPYAGVWHLDSSASGRSADATGGSRDIYVNTAIEEAGRFGNARRINTGTGFASNGTSVVPSGRAMMIPEYSALALGDTFTVSGWFKHNSSGYYYDRIFSRANGFSFAYNGWNGYSFQLGGTSSVKASLTANIDNNKWVKYTLAYDGASLLLYTNGVRALTVSLGSNAAADNAEPLYVGGTASQYDADSTTIYAGLIDEIRLIDGAQSPERIRVEHLLEADSEALTYSQVVDEKVQVSVFVTSNVDGLGQPVPSYGQHESDEGITSISSGPEVLRNGVIYAANRYTIETSEDGGISWSDPVEHAGNSFAYSYDGRVTRVTWLWEPYAAPVCISSSHASGQLAYSAEPYKTIDGVRYYQVGTTLTVTASDAEASSFREWQDAGPEVSANGAVATITVGTTPIKMTAISRHPWIFDNGVLSDGAWSLSAQLTDKTNPTNLTIKSVSATPAFGVFDLTEGIRSADGNTTYALFKFADNAFKGNGTLRSVHLEPGLQQLGWCTFQNCTNLTTFVPLLPDTLSNSNNGQVFDGCSCLTGDVVFASRGVTSWGNKMFARTKVTSLYAPYLTDISGGLVFDSCPALTNVVMPEIVKIGMRSFRECTALQSVTLGDSLEELGNEAFVRCTALASVMPCLPDSLRTIGTSAFENCTALSGVMKLKSLKNISEKAFNNVGFASVEASAATNAAKMCITGSSTLESVTFGRESVTLSAYNPIGLKAGGGVYFPGKAPTPPFGQALFGWSSYKTIVYCDPVVDPEGWAALMSNPDVFRLAEESEKTAANSYPGENTLGLLKAPNGLYWLVKYRSPLRKPGLILLIR